MKLTIPIRGYTDVAIIIAILFPIRFDTGSFYLNEMAALRIKGRKSRYQIIIVNESKCRQIVQSFHPLLEGFVADLRTTKINHLDAQIRTQMSHIRRYDLCLSSPFGVACPINYRLAILVSQVINIGRTIDDSVDRQINIVVNLKGCLAEAGMNPHGTTLA